MPAGFRSVFLLFGLSASAAVVPPPPPPPPVASPADATPVRLTPAQIARLRGHVPPPRRQLADEEAELEAVSVDALRPRERPAGPTRPALLKTARVADPGPDWAPTLVLAQADLHRRQALAQAAEDEEALLLMLVLLEVL